MRLQVHWRDLVIGAAAIWLIASPLVLGYDVGELPDSRAAALNSYAVGTGLLLFCIISAWRLEDFGNEILNIVFGCWLALSPYALAFADRAAATLNTIAVGVLVVVLAIWDLKASA